MRDIRKPLKSLAENVAKRHRLWVRTLDRPFESEDSRAAGIQNPHRLVEPAVKVVRLDVHTHLLLHRPADAGLVVALRQSNHRDPAREFHRADARYFQAQVGSE